MSAPKFWRITCRIPRKLRIELLKALAWPEFEVSRLWVASDPTAPNGMRVDRIPLEETLERESQAAAALFGSAHNAR